MILIIIKAALPVMEILFISRRQLMEPVTRSSIRSRVLSEEVMMLRLVNYVD